MGKPRVTGIENRIRQYRQGPSGRSSFSSTGTQRCQNRGRGSADDFVAGNQWLRRSGRSGPGQDGEGDGLQDLVTHHHQALIVQEPGNRRQKQSAQLGSGSWITRIRLPDSTPLSLIRFEVATLGTGGHPFI